MPHLLSLILLACSGGPTPPASESPAAPAVPATPTVQPSPAQDAAGATPPIPPDQRFVSGSTLNLRAEPKGKVIGKLSINSRVTELETKDDWTRVKVGNGKEGWVGSDYLGTQPITVEEAVAKARQTGELSWWQRAAAISPEREVLEGLEAAYRAAGKADLARQVEDQLRWPRQLLLAWQPWKGLPPGKTVVEWSRAGYGHELQRTVPRAAWRRYGLEEDDVFWVLPSRGAAVKARATRLSHDVENDCSEEWSRNVWLEHAPLEEGVVAVAAWRGKAPESWEQDLQPKMGREKAEVEIRSQLKLEGKGEVAVSIAPSGNGWVGYARVENGRFGELGNELYDEVEVRWAPEPKGVFISGVHETGGTRKAISERDVLGNGKTLMVREDGCATYAYDGENELKSTVYRCCGC